MLEMFGNYFKNNADCIFAFLVIIRIFAYTKISKVRSFIIFCEYF